MGPSLRWSLARCPSRLLSGLEELSLVPCVRWVRRLFIVRSRSGTAALARGSRSRPRRSLVWACGPTCGRHGLDGIAPPAAPHATYWRSRGADMVFTYRRRAMRTRCSMVHTQAGALVFRRDSALKRAGLARLAVMDRYLRKSAAEAQREPPKRQTRPSVAHSDPSLRLRVQPERAPTGGRDTPQRACQ
jgi:hypothetical protein